jgi:hypothetical protein
MWKGLVGKWSGPIGRRDRVGVVKVHSRLWRETDPFYVPLVGVCWRESVLKLLGGCLLSLSMCKRGFHDLLKFRPSSLHTYPPMKTELIQCSETSAYKIQMPGNYQEDNILPPQQGESLKTTIQNTVTWNCTVT